MFMATDVTVFGDTAHLMCVWIGDDKRRQRMVFLAQSEGAEIF